jgi:hypothetical protein
MSIILVCTRDTSCAAMIYLLGFLTMSHSINIWRARAYLKISANVEHPLHPGILRDKGGRPKLATHGWVGLRMSSGRYVDSLTSLQGMNG